MTCYKEIYSRLCPLKNIKLDYTTISVKFIWKFSMSIFVLIRVGLCFKRGISPVIGFIFKDSSTIYFPVHFGNYIKHSTVVQHKVTQQRCMDLLIQQLKHEQKFYLLYLKINTALPCGGVFSGCSWRSVRCFSCKYSALQYSRRFPEQYLS